MTLLLNTFEWSIYKSVKRRYHGVENIQHGEQDEAHCQGTGETSRVAECQYLVFGMVYRRVVSGLYQQRKFKARVVADDESKEAAQNCRHHEEHTLLVETQ